MVPMDFVWGDVERHDGRLQFRGAMHDKEKTIGIRAFRIREEL